MALTRRASRSRYLALITPRAPVNLYRPSSSQGTLEDGELGIGPDDTVINRIRVQSDGDWQINEGGQDVDGNSAVIDFRPYFETGDGNDLTLTVVTLQGEAEWDVADNISSGAINGIRWNVPDSDNSDIIDAIGDGDRFIFALWKDQPTGQDIAAAGSLPGPGAGGATVSIRQPDGAEIAGSGTSPSPSGSAGVTTGSSAGALEIEAAGTLNAPTGSASVASG